MPFYALENLSPILSLVRKDADCNFNISEFVETT